MKACCCLPFENTGASRVHVCPRSCHVIKQSYPAAHKSMCHTQLSAVVKPFSLTGVADNARAAHQRHDCDASVEDALASSSPTRNTSSALIVASATAGFALTPACSTHRQHCNWCFKCADASTWGLAPASGILGGPRSGCEAARWPWWLCKGSEIVFPQFNA